MTKNIRMIFALLVISPILASELYDPERSLFEANLATLIMVDYLKDETPWLWSRLRERDVGRVHPEVHRLMAEFVEHNGDVKRDLELSEKLAESPLKRELRLQFVGEYERVHESTLVFLGEKHSLESQTLEENKLRANGETFLKTLRTKQKVEKNTLETNFDTFHEAIRAEQVRAYQGLFHWYLLRSGVPKEQVGDHVFTNQLGEMVLQDLERKGAAQRVLEAKKQDLKLRHSAAVKQAVKVLKYFNIETEGMSTEDIFFLAARHEKKYYQESAVEMQLWEETEEIRLYKKCVSDCADEANQELWGAYSCGGKEVEGKNIIFEKECAYHLSH